LHGVGRGWGVACKSHPEKRRASLCSGMYDLGRRRREEGLNGDQESVWIPFSMKIQGSWEQITPVSCEREELLRGRGVDRGWSWLSVVGCCAGVLPEDERGSC